MNVSLAKWPPIVVFLLFLVAAGAQAEPVVYPYLQNLSRDAVDLYWVDSHSEPVRVEWLERTADSVSLAVPELNYQAQELIEFPHLKESPARFLHKVTLTGLGKNDTVSYKVQFEDSPFAETFRTLPNEGEPVRLIAFSDSETEPESTGKRAKWGTPGDPLRKYLVDQTEGYHGNLTSIRQRKPDAILIAGDLVESGGEQRDWDEFWKHARTVAGSIPLLPAPGNHEYWAGPKHGGYSEDGARWAISKYRTYFHPGGEEKAPHYYSREIGPVTLLSLDSGDGLPHGTEQDTNHFLEAAGAFAPGYHPESEQVAWLEQELRAAQEAGRFIVVMFHHCPYSSGTHGFEPGKGENRDEQSGQPLRALTQVFHRYGVDLVLTGHDEMFERSEVQGVEQLPDGKTRPHTLQIYDVGVAGDGLRGPERENEYSRFLAYRDCKELWDGGRLTKGGRHYGHLEIDVTGRPGKWEAVLTPVYVLPTQKKGRLTFERREYPDVVELNGS
jgi:3',5'-cyclic AMP phosphodiesterase CpdA